MNKKKKHRKWSREELASEALYYNRRYDFQKGSSGAYYAAYKMGILDEICSHMENVLNSWNLESISAEALKYKNIKALQRGCQSAYNAAVRLGILDQICSHMERLHIEWTFEMIKEEALKYKSRWEFQKKSNAYYSAKRLGILDIVCSHMSTPNISSEEKEILEEVRKIFPDTKKHRITKLKIPGKEFIHWFEADIFVPSLMKAIEFDGTYWHSFKYMRKCTSKSKWSDEDLMDYHQIKDLAFLSRGIQVLHINGAEWKNNKKECIERCLKFLGVFNEQQVA